MNGEYLITGESARWSVIWLVRKGDKQRLVEHEFGNDLNEALRIYILAKNAGKPMATLRSMNVGFPPPEKYRPRTKMVRVGRKFVEHDIFLMREVNDRGIWWCPYCREMRRFIKVDGFRVGDVLVEESGSECPVCGVSHRDAHVRRWNPRASIMYTAPVRKRRSPTKTTRRRK